MLVEQMIWEEYRDEVSRRIIILPVGSLEQHGPHLPLNVDVVIPTSLAKMVDCTSSEFLGQMGQFPKGGFSRS